VRGSKRAPGDKPEGYLAKQRCRPVPALLKLSRGVNVPITALFDEFPPSTVRRMRL
jgi:hypothetical protein